MMFKTFSISLLLALSFFSCTEKSSNSSPNASKNETMANTVTEMVIYQLKKDKVASYAPIADVTNTFLKNQKGFISRKIMQDHKDPSIFADVVEWQTLTDAEAAMEKSQQDPTLLPFFEATEKVISMGHYSFFK